MVQQSTDTPPRWLIFARHGRTFATGQAPVWLGCNQDVSLSAPGMLDGKHLGEGLAAMGVPLAFALQSPLVRAQQTLSLALEQLRQADQQAPTQVAVDARLTELNFGRWNGLGSRELEERSEAKDAWLWTHKRQWPPRAGFAPSEQVLFDEAHAVLAACRQRLLALKQTGPAAGLVVSHGARLRFMLASLTQDSEYAAPNDKLGCGQVGLCRLGSAGFAPVAWNKSPEALQALLTRNS